MKTKILIMAALFSAAALSANAGISFNFIVGVPVYSAPCPPPAPPVIVETVPPCPSPDYVWASGYWSYRPTGYVWVHGCWNYRFGHEMRGHYYGEHHRGDHR